jgi:signal transduction histidine kinase
MIGIVKRLLPRGIAGQIALLVVTSLLLAQAVTITTFFLVNPRLSLVDAPGAPITRLAFTAKLLEAIADPHVRAEIVRAASDSVPALEWHEGPVPVERGPDDPLVKGVQAYLGDRFDVFASRPADAADHVIRLGIRLPHGEILVAPLSHRHFGPGGLSPGLLGTLAFLACAVALLSLWAATMLTAPLTRVADAAESFTVGRSDAPLPERGPKEIVRVAKALNGMRERVQRLVEDRGHMLAAISHDLRTPITRLRLRAEEIGQEPLRTQFLRDLETMQNMVHSALAFLRDQAKKVSPVTIDLPSLIQTVCDVFGDLGREVAFVGPAHLYIEGDPDQLARAISNLVDNGLKFGGSVIVRLEARSAGDICIAVEDDGPGIPDMEKQRVLEPFYRADPARNLDGQDGSGLGLSISRVIIEAHHGKLELLDGLPRGLVARLTLPHASQPRHA